MRLTIPIEEATVAQLRGVRTPLPAGPAGVRAKARPMTEATSRPSRGDLVAILERVGEQYPFETAVDDAAKRGFEFRLTWSDPASAYEEVWEHPAATEYNATLDRGTAAILDACLFKLYELRSERTSLSSAPPYVLVVGAVGNTNTYEVWTAGV